MVDPIYRRAFEQAYGYNLTCGATTYETADGKIQSFSDDKDVGTLFDIGGDLMQASTYFPPASFFIGIIASLALTINLITDKTKSRNEKIISIAYISRYLIAATSCGFLAAPLDIGATISRKIRMRALKKTMISSNSTTSSSSSTSSSKKPVKWSVGIGSIRVGFS